jgi:hypothetical protein
MRKRADAQARRRETDKGANAQFHLLCAKSHSALSTCPSNSGALGSQVNEMDSSFPVRAVA